LTYSPLDVILLKVLHLKRGTEIMRVTSKGQVTIPRNVRQRLGIFPQSEVEFVVEGNTVILRTVTGDISRGKKLIETLRGRATVRMTTDEIMALTRGEG
jgi:AbrB family looped-hinge helix DNA binding protein